MTAPFLRTEYQVQHVLLELCPPLRFPPPWNFLDENLDCRWPVVNPSNTLARLLETYSMELLDSAGILARTPHGELRLRPDLCNPVGAIIGLRRKPGHWPFGFLTARGFTMGSGAAIWPAFYDGWTRQRIEDTGLLIAAFQIREVALLRSLGLPATLCPAFHRMNVDQLQLLDQAFAGPDYTGQDCVVGSSVQAKVPGTTAVEQPRPASPNDSASGKGGTVPSTSTEAPPRGAAPVELPTPAPTLVLLAWSPLTASDRVSPFLGRAANTLALARRYLGFPFAGIQVWQPTHRYLENLHYRIARSNAELVRELLLESTQELYDFERFTDGASNPDSETALSANDFVTAHAELLACLATDRGHGQVSARTQAARGVYAEAVQRELLDPLRAWALASSEPIVQNAGIEVAEVFQLLHQMAPLLHELQGREFERLAAGGKDFIPPQALAQYLRLGNRAGAIIRDLHRWSK